MTETAQVPEKQTKQLTVKDLFSNESYKKKFEELLGKKTQGFITSVLQCVASNKLLKEADPLTVYNAAAVAATLDLPINQNLGFAYIIPYSESYKDNSGQWKKRQVAQFQMGYKGFIQLAQRSGQFKTIAATPIYEGQLIAENPLTGFEFDFTKKTSGKIIGYAGYFQLLNGFEKTVYATVQELTDHGKKYSQSFKNGGGIWKENFDAMAVKTILKLMLSKYAPLSIEMQKAVVTDQAVVMNEEGTDLHYTDHEEIIDDTDKEQERLLLMLGDCKSPEDVDLLQGSLPEADSKLFDEKREELKKSSKK